MARSIREQAAIAGVAPSTMRRRLHRLNVLAGGRLLERGPTAKSPIRVDERVLADMGANGILDLVATKEELEILRRIVEQQGKELESLKRSFQKASWLGLRGQ